MGYVIERLFQFSRFGGENRLVYEIANDQIIVKSCKGHYED